MTRSTPASASTRSTTVRTASRIAVPYSAFQTRTTGERSGLGTGTGRSAGSAGGGATASGGGPPEGGHHRPRGHRRRLDERRLHDPQAGGRALAERGHVGVRVGVDELA